MTGAERVARWRKAHRPKLPWGEDFEVELAKWEEGGLGAVAASQAHTSSRGPLAAPAITKAQSV